MTNHNNNRGNLKVNFNDSILSKKLSSSYDGLVIDLEEMLTEL